MPATAPVYIEVLDATAGTAPAWSVKVTKARQVGTAVVIPLGGTGGGTSGAATQASAPTIGTDGQTLTFNATTTGASQPSSLKVAAIYTGE
ncbi:MAG: hypothetical protein ACREB9_02815 [Thermoplasmata archaeon]